MPHDYDDWSETKHRSRQPHDDGFAPVWLVIIGVLAVLAAAQIVGWLK